MRPERGIGFAPKAALGADASSLMADRPPSAEATEPGGFPAVETSDFTCGNGGTWGVQAENSSWFHKGRTSGFKSP